MGTRMPGAGGVPAGPEQPPGFGVSVPASFRRPAESGVRPATSWMVKVVLWAALLRRMLSGNSVVSGAGPKSSIFP